MNLLPVRPTAQPLAVHEKFFLEFWFGMTHELSLDSHRVRCLNARSAVRELDHELQLGRLAQEEFVELCNELDEILSLDNLVPKVLPRHYSLLKPLLKNPPPVAPEKRKDAKLDQSYR